MEYYLGVDVGTQSSKASIYSRNGELISNGISNHKLLYPKPGWVELDAEAVLNNVIEAISIAVKSSNIPPDNIRSMAISGLICSTLLIDSKGLAITPCILHLDRRAQEEVQELKNELKEQWIDESGSSTIDCFVMPVTYRWLKKHHPSVTFKAARIIPLPTYISCRLAGHDANDGYLEPTQISGWIYGINAFKRNISFSQMEQLGLSKSLFSPVRECNSIIGKLTKKMSIQTGLYEGLTIAAGAGDIQQSALATGLTQPGRAVDIAGTASIFCLGVQKIHPEISRKEGILHILSTLPGQSIYFGYILAGGFSLQWFRNLFTKLNKDFYSFKEMDLLAENVSTGSEGLMFFPYLAGGGHKYQGASGTFMGMFSNTNTGTVWRSILESIAFEYANFIQYFHSADLPIEKVYAIGGGSNSSLWNQIKSDINNIPWITSSDNYDATFANAALAALAVNDVKDLKATLDQWKTHENSFKPDSKSHLYYSSLSKIRNQILEQYLSKAYLLHKKIFSL